MQKRFRTQIRLPREIEIWLKQKAEVSGRSMNGQLVRELERCQLSDLAGRVLLIPEGQK